MKAYQMNVANTWAELEVQLIEAGGEVGSDLEIRLQHFATNVDTCASMMDRLENFEAFMKQKADFYSKMAKTASNSRDFLKETIKAQMIDKNLKELSGNESRFVLSNSKASVQIPDESAVDPAYVNETIVKKIDKKRIEEDLKLGIPVAGASLKETKALKIFASREVQ